MSEKNVCQGTVPTNAIAGKGIEEQIQEQNV